MDRDELSGSADTGLPVQLHFELAGGSGFALPHRLEPMMSHATAEPFDSSDFLFEVRWDSVRAIAIVENGHLVLYNRRLGEIQERFPELVGLPHQLSEQPAILDGEIVVVDDLGRPDFETLQRRLEPNDGLTRHSESIRPACYLAQDILFKGTRWITGEPLVRRKRLLADLVRASDAIYLSEHFDTEGVALFDAAADSELEGVVAKAKASTYTPGVRSSQWLSIRRAKRGEFVVGGYSPQISGGSRSTQLLLGAYDLAGRLAYVGGAVAPPDEPRHTELFAALNALQVDRPPFVEPPRFVATWVRPELVATVRYGRWELGQALRFPAFERIRLDVSPEECLLPLTPTPEGSSDSHAPRKRPRLTMLTTLPLPLPDQPVPRPNLRIVSAGEAEEGGA